MASPTQTRITSPAALQALGIALVLGLLGDLLFKGAPAAGLNALLWVLALVAAARIARRDTPDAPAGQGRWLLVAAGFATCMVIRDAEYLQVFNVFAIIAALGIACLPWLAPHQQRARAQDVVRALFHAFASFWTGVFLLAGDADWSAVRGTSSRRTRGILGGLALAVPIVIVFGSLFSSADPAFAALMESLVGWDIGNIVVHVLVIGFVAWFSAGLLRAWGWKPQFWVSQHPAPSTQHPSFSATTIGIVLGAMATVFLLFVSLQARYLFGGEATILSVSGLSYAEYARQGFFQMVAATALVIPILYAANTLMPKDNPRALQSLRALGGVQLGLTMAVCVSAVTRMVLYIGAYGLTEDRIIASAILVWLAAVIIIFANTVLRGRSERFSYAAIVAGFVTLGGLNAVNPDAQIARVNIQRASEGKEMDVAYLGRLGADASPVLLTHIARLPIADQCHVEGAIRGRWAGADRDWRGFNVARSRAMELARGIDNSVVCGR